MAKQKLAQAPENNVDLGFPFRGLDTSSPFGRQTPGTTRDSQNIRSYQSVTDIMRGGVRPGISKLLTDNLDGSIQNLNSLVVATNQTAGTGYALTNVHTSTGAVTKATLYKQSDGTVAYTSADYASVRSMACSDEDGFFYWAAAFSGTIKVYKLGPATTAGDYELKWDGVPTTTTIDAGSGTLNIAGITAFEGKVYVFVVTGSSSDDIGAPGIYRYDQADGTLMDTGAWMTSGTHGLATVTGVTVDFGHQNICAGNGVIGVVGKSGSNLVLQQFNIATRLLLYSTTLETYAVPQAKLIQDAGGNFYALTNAGGVAGGNNNLIKRVSSAGVNDWTQTSDTKTCRDIAFDLYNFYVIACGTDIFTDAAMSFKRFVGSTGTVVDAVDGAHWAPDSHTDWTAVACAGDGTYRLRASAAADDVQSFTNSVVQSWAKDSGDDGAATQWIVCSKTNVEPTPR